MKELVKLDGLPRDEWLEVRRKGIGSSDVGGICGLSRFSSPLSVWLDKTGQAPEREETDRMRRGRWLEDAVAQEWAHETGRTPVKPAFMFQSDEHPFMLASPDRFIVNRRTLAREGVLEIKTSTVPEQWEAGPPQEVVLQELHQMIVCGVHHGSIAVLLNGRDFRHWSLEYDEKLAASLIEIETEFWSLVEKGEPPPADGHEATTEALAYLYRDAEPDVVVDLTAHHETLVRLRDVRAREKAIGEQKAELENTIKQAMGTATVGLYNGAEVVTWKAGTKFDVDTFKAEQPDAYAQFRKPGVDLDALKRERPDLDAKYRIPNAGARRFLPKGSAK